MSETERLHVLIIFKMVTGICGDGADAAARHANLLINAFMGGEKGGKSYEKGF